MRLLVTNDDGIESEGIHVLARHLHAAGHDVVVVAPDRDWSGAGAALGLVRPDSEVDVQRIEIPGGSEIEAWAVDGPPAFTAVLGNLGAFGPVPDAIVSGINAGANTGRSVLFSGTVGAVLAGQTFGLSGLAVSTQSSDPWQWEAAATIAVDTLELLAEAPPRSALNLNVPARPREEILGVRWAHLAPFGAVRSAVRTTETGRLQFELVPTDFSPAADTDEALLRAGYATLTTLVGVVEAWPADEGLGEATPAYVDRIVPGADLEPVHRVPDGSDHRTLRRPTTVDG